MNFEVQTHTFGCKVNTYDSGLIEKNLKREGAFEFARKVHVLNSCAVTSEATQQASRLIRKIKSENPSSLVVVTGCAAQVDTDSFLSSQADLIVANSHKSELPNLIQQLIQGRTESRVFKSNIFKKEDLEIGGGVESEHTRSFLKIQDGCNSFCSFCIIPYARGKSRSISITDLCNRVVELYEQGLREVVLTGVHVGDFDDEGRKLEDLLQALLVRTPMPRFRLSSLEPIEVSDRLLELYQDPRMCAHFHMSIQSANSDVLKDMKRKYGQREVRQSLEKIAKNVPHAFVGMDVIAGFPTESFEKFEDTYLCLADLPWTRLHVFPYSERPGTRAAELMEQIPFSERKNRARRLRELSADRYQDWGFQQVGKTQKALLFSKPNSKSQGLTREYCNIRFDSAESLDSLKKITGEVPVRLKSFEWLGGSSQDGRFLAEVIQESL
ncbi:MAG: tRNA (N(6)-L-threonylcarbamoyladenosine(37)-C(2))-methylthiotransferase MtaB [Bdellovibrionales bacterium]